jgi:16S rRNA (guanine966-N2)-methyltransferase
MRIIAGSAKGRRLYAPRGHRTRPFTDRAKEALFSSLGTLVVGARVLDLYAGSGSLGLEALSRGAASAVFVERNRAALVALQRNVDAVGRGGEIVADTVQAYLGEAAVTFDLVFVDPPYGADAGEVDEVLSATAAHLGQGAVVVVHRRRDSPPPLPPPGLQLVDRRRYGDAELWRFDKEIG